MRLAILALLLASAHVAAAQSGLWTSEGYGMFFDASADTLRAYEVTSVSCIPSFTAAAVPAPAGAVAAYRFTTAPVTMLLLRDQSPNGLRFHMNGAAPDILLRRAAARPSTCQRPTANTPASNFDVFATTWAEQYGFFDIRHADWASTVAANRPRVSDTTSDATL